MAEPPLSALTVAQLKELQATHGIKLASGLSKEQLVAMILGWFRDRQLGNPITELKYFTPELPYSRLVPTAINLAYAKEPPLLLKPTITIGPPITVDLPPRGEYPTVPPPTDKSPLWLHHLHRHGWTIVPVPGVNVPACVRAFGSWLESGHPELKFNDPRTWTADRMPKSYKGLLRHHYAHEPFQWHIREACYPVFREIWQTDQLLASFDGGSLMHQTGNGDSWRAWFHADHGRESSYQMESVQGFVTLSDCGPEDGGLVLLHGSREVYHKYLATHPSEGIIGYKVDIHDPSVKDLPMLKMCLPAGYLMLWDSRMFHCNVPPRSKQIRLVQYVSMLPAMGCDAATLQKRKELYEKGMMTNHWCYGR